MNFLLSMRLLPLQELNRQICSAAAGLMPQAEEILADYEKQFKDRHTRFKLLCRCRAHILILVYDTELTEKIFQKKVTQNYLARFGYEANTGVQDFLNQIAAKIAGGESFPHEIGIILGYPPEDIEGFKRYKGRNFKCCGYWKVYGNAERAQKCLMHIRCAAKTDAGIAERRNVKVAAAAI